MFRKILLIGLIFNCLFIVNINCYLSLDVDSERYPLSSRVHEDALNPDLCRRQLRYLSKNDSLLLATYLDAGIRVPRGILMGNVIDLGNFHQCLGINEKVEDMVISGKYCRISVPANQEWHLPLRLGRKSLRFDPTELRVSKKILEKLEIVSYQKGALNARFLDDDIDESSLAGIKFQLAICIPRPCTTKEAINGLLFNFTEIGLAYNDISCRLPDDKPWVAGDYVAVVVFSMLGIVTLISTCYDLYQSLYLKKGRKDINTVYSSFSVYTNSRRLLSFNSSPGTLECLDGVRALAMVWVLIGHSFFTTPQFSNPIETFQWITSAKAWWVMAAPLTVDTFFFLSGLLLVYNTAGKIGSMQLLKNLHVFYLNRLLRMFPVLATVVLFKATHYIRTSDGPLWTEVALQTAQCRRFWWSTLLYVQTIVNPRQLCVGVTWYLALDVQLHILSPIILFWVLSGRRAAWTALSTSLLLTLIASTIYVFLNNFTSAIISPNRQDELVDFLIYYYINILTRAAPFLIGMIYGYIFHLWMKNKTYISKVLTYISLLLALLLLVVVMYCSQISSTPDWDNQIADNLINSFLRPLWALGLGWIIFACLQGRAEPINWFLSLHIWKLPARISYAMYLVHYSIMSGYYSSMVAPMYFTAPLMVFHFMAFLFITMIVAFFLTLLVDSPFSTIFKLILGNSKKPQTIAAIESKDSTNNIINGRDNVGFAANDSSKTLQALNLENVNGDLKLNINEVDALSVEEKSKNK